jgi:hypothetical protein
MHYALVTSRVSTHAYACILLLFFPDTSFANSMIALTAMCVYDNMLLGFVLRCVVQRSQGTSSADR